MGKPNRCLAFKIGTSANIGDCPLRIRTVGGEGGRREPTPPTRYCALFFRTVRPPSRQDVLPCGPISLTYMGSLYIQHEQLDDYLC